MLLLILDITTDLINSGGAYGESRISLLPRKVLLRNFLMNPLGRTLFQFSHKIGQDMRGPKLNQNVNMIRGTANAFAFPAEPVDGASQILMQARTPHSVNERFPFFR